MCAELQFFKTRLLLILVLNFSGMLHLSHGVLRGNRCSENNGEQVPESEPTPAQDETHKL